MRPNRPITALLRLLLAVAFGFMSLGHGPVMAFSHAAAPAQHHQAVAAEHTHAHHHASANPAMAQPAADTALACYSVGCFVGLQSFALAAPAVSLDFLGKLVPGPTRVVAIAPAGPADPPPRLQD